MVPHRRVVQFARALAKRAGGHSHENLLESYGCRGRVAQLGEHLLCKQGVRGSNPLTSTKTTLPLSTYSHFFGGLGIEFRSIRSNYTYFGQKLETQPRSLRRRPRDKAEFYWKSNFACCGSVHGLSCSCRRTPVMPFGHSDTR